jgi:hypothetical protein
MASILSKDFMHALSQTQEMSIQSKASAKVGDPLSASSLAGMTCSTTLKLNSPQGFVISVATQKRTLLPVSYSSQFSWRTLTPAAHLLAIDADMFPVTLTPILPLVKASWTTPARNKQNSRQPGSIH